MSLFRWSFLIASAAAWTGAPVGTAWAQPSPLFVPQVRVSFDAPAPAAAATAGAPAQTQSASSRAFNPDISVIGNFIGVAGKNPMNEEPALQLSEAEFAFQAVIDPYSRADFYVAVGPEGAELEEGFITFTALPGNLLLKAGKMRAQFGKMNTLHTHRLPAADRSLLTDNLLGGDEGLSDSGMSLSHLIPSDTVFVELTGEVYAGRSDVFESEDRAKLVYLGRARAYRDVTESTNVDVGFSYAHGPAPVGDDFGDAEDGFAPGRDLYGIDITLRYRPLREAIYRRMNLRTELVWSRQEIATDLRTTAFGFYALAEYQFARRWYVGGRLDRSGRAFDGDLVDKGGSVFLTFWPTEFSQVRGQYRHVSYAERVSGNELLFQFNFSIGAHGAHVF